MCFRDLRWLGQPPVTHAEKWSTREQEVAGFADYVVSLQKLGSAGKRCVCRRDRHVCALARYDLATFVE